VNLPSPSFEQRPEEVVLEGRADVQRAEEDAAQVADRALEGHPHLSRAVDVTRAVVHEQTEERVGLAASGAAFWLVISVFPTAIAAISLFGLVVSPEQVASDLGNLARGAPSSLSSLITAQLRRVAASDHTGLSMGLAISVLFAIWSASAGVYNLDRAIRVAYGLDPQTYIEARARALVGAIIVVLALGGGALGISFVVSRSPSQLVVILGIPALLIGMVAAVTVLYRFSVGGNVKLGSLLPGALVSSVGVVALIAGFGIYVAASKRYTAVYGVFAGAVIGMVATYLAVYVVLLGAVLNTQLTSTVRSRDRL
jgi:membrane protein